MNQRAKYHGKETLIVGNGDQLDKTHIGQFCLLSITHNIHSLSLKYIFHVPTITKNL